MNKTTPGTKKILLAEDDEDDFILFREALNDQEAINLNWVRDGEELINILKKDITALPDMIFLDINMPRKNGFECLTEIRQSENLEQLPVIIFSTSNDRALISWMYNAGANLYLIKPTHFKTLKENVEKAIAMDWKVQTPYLPVKDFVLS